MADLPGLMMWVDAYEADTGHLSYAEHGLYLKLLFLMWRTPDCRVPDDDAWLARRMRLSVEDVAAQLRPLIGEFCQAKGGWLTQKRLSHEYVVSKEKREKKRAAAKSRWEKENDTCNSIDDAHAGDATPHMQNAASVHAPIPIPIKKDNNPARDEALRVCSLLGIDVHRHASPAALFVQYAELLRDFTASELVAAAEKAKAQGSKPSSLRFLKPIALELREQAKPPPVVLDVICRPHEWERRCLMFFEGLPRTTYPDERDDSKPKGTWSAPWGPKPGEPGCLCPDEVLSRFKHVEKT